MNNKLTTIQNNDSLVYTSGKLKTLKQSEYMYPTIKGNVISVNDVNPITHKLSVGLRSKNLFNPETVILTNATISDGVITQTDVKKSATIDIPLSTTGAYTISFKSNHTRDFWIRNGQVTNGYISHIMPEETVRTIGITSLVDGYLRLHAFGVGADSTIEPFVLSDFQIELNKVQTEYTPCVSDLSNIQISRCGTNLFDISKIKGHSDCVNNGDGTLTVKSYPISCGVILRELCPSLKVGDTVILKFNTTSNLKQVYIPPNFYWPNGSFKTITEEMLNSKVYFYCIKETDGTLSPATISDIQVSFVNTGYEPYVEPQIVTANSDGTVEGLTSLSPKMTLLSNNNGVLIDCKYLRDIDTYIDNQIMNVALTGGE